MSTVPAGLSTGGVESRQRSRRPVPTLDADAIGRGMVRSWGGNYSAGCADRRLGREERCPVLHAAISVRSRDPAATADRRPGILSFEKVAYFQGVFQIELIELNTHPGRQA